MGRKARKSAEKRQGKKQAEEEALILEEAKKISADIGLQVDFESDCEHCIIEISKIIVECGRNKGLQVDFESDCEHCIIEISKIIVECGRNKGLIFHKLYRIGFHNCGGELKGRAVYKDKVYEVDEHRNIVELIERKDKAFSVAQYY
eukprot:919478_1